MSTNLSPKQEAFCLEYEQCLNALKIDYPFEQEGKNFYVYFLVHPLTGEIFYVGKGKNGRKDQHLANYYNRRFDNSFKHTIIDHIVQMGLLPKAVIFANNLQESEAFDIERLLIESLPDLTNIQRGQTSAFEKSKVHAALWVAKIIPFDEWCALRNPTEQEKEIYHLVSEGLRDIAANGHENTFKFQSYEEKEIHH